MIDTLILHAPGAEPFARALKAAWRNREPAHACAVGGAPMAVGRHLLLVGVLGSPPAAPAAEQQMLDTMADQSLAAVLLLAPGREAPRGLDEIRLPAVASSGDAAADVAAIDNKLRALGRLAVFDKAARSAFAVIGRPRAPRLETGARPADWRNEFGAGEGAAQAAPAPNPGELRRQRFLGYFLGIGLGLAAVALILGPRAFELLGAGGE